MATKVKIIGAGSVGNHHANACRAAGFEVAVVDSNQDALRRMREDIYPKRYGAWDEGIKLYTAAEAPKGGFDVVVIGTPPDSHLAIGSAILRDEAPRVLLIEKPLCTPTLEGLEEFLAETKQHSETAVLVGYNHILAENTLKTEEIIRSGVFCAPQALDCEFRSNWLNILKAHPWLNGPADTYLGFWRRGGGAGGEHSHGLNLWQHFAHLLGAGKILAVDAMMDYVNEGGAEYDRSCFLNLVTEGGLVGRLAQDVITEPKRKFLDIHFENGTLSWRNDVSKTSDEVHIQKHGADKQVIEIAKTRTEEFGRETEHIRKILAGELKYEESPLRLERGVDTMLVLAAAHLSHAESRRTKIDYANSKVI
jgi:predicted dehydrogenase